MSPVTYRAVNGNWNHLTIWQKEKNQGLIQKESKLLQGKLMRVIYRSFGRWTLGQWTLFRGRSSAIADFHRSYLVLKGEFPDYLCPVSLFHAFGVFLYPLKTLVNFCFSDVFRVYGKRPVTLNGLNEVLWLQWSVLFLTECWFWIWYCFSRYFRKKGWGTL